MRINYNRLALPMFIAALTALNMGWALEGLGWTFWQKMLPILLVYLRPLVVELYLVWRDAQRRAANSGITTIYNSHGAAFYTRPLVYTKLFGWCDLL